MATEMKLQGFYVDKENEIRMEQYAKDQKISISEVIRRSLTLFLALHLDYPESMRAVYALARKKDLDPNYVLDQAIKKAVPKKYFKD